MGVNRPGGYVPSQSAVTSEEPVGAINVRRGTSISFEDCTFAHLGALYGLSIGTYSQNVRVNR